MSGQGASPGDGTMVDKESMKEEDQEEDAESEAKGFRFRKDRQNMR